MGDETNREGLQQQPSDNQREQAGQQNQQGETRTPQQQQEDAARNAPGQQNQQNQGERRDDDAELNRAKTNPLDDGLEGGVDTGAIQPGNTGQR